MDVSSKPPMMEVPAHVHDQIAAVCEKLFAELRQHGNSKNNCIMILEEVMDQLQGSVLPYARQMKIEHANNFNVSLIALTALVRVSLNNPMWGSEALTLQLKEEVRQILKGGIGFRLDEDDT